MSTHRNRVKMTVSGTPGTGTITLSAASSGYQSFATAYGANATVDILITDGTAWEVARDCTYTNSGTTVTRGTLEASSTGSAVSFTSAAVVSEVATATKGDWHEVQLRSVIPGGRLTLESGVPVSTTDQTAKTSVYYTPYVHNVINLWDGANWVPTEFTEKTLALGTLTSGLPYDVFGYLSAGALVLESLAWTNGTTRATAVTLQDGRYCKSGDKTRLLLGTFYTTATTTTEDSAQKRFLSNIYNTVLRQQYVAPGGTQNTTAGPTEYSNAGALCKIEHIVSAPSGAAVSVALTGSLVSTVANDTGRVALNQNTTTPALATAVIYDGILYTNAFRPTAAAQFRSATGYTYFTLTIGRLAGTGTVTVSSPAAYGSLSC